MSWGNFRISYTYSKALDDVSEFFFSAPDQQFQYLAGLQPVGRRSARPPGLRRHGAHARWRAATTAWERISHGFQLTTHAAILFRAAFQHHHRREYRSGDLGASHHQRRFHQSQCRIGFDFLNLGARLSRSFRFSEKLRLEALAEAFNLTNHMNGVTLNGVFGTGAYPTNPSPTYKQITAVDDPRTMQFALRIQF